MWYGFVFLFLFNYQGKTENFDWLTGFETQYLNWLTGFETHFLGIFWKRTIFKKTIGNIFPNSWKTISLRNEQDKKRKNND